MSFNSKILVLIIAAAAVAAVVVISVARPGGDRGELYVRISAEGTEYAVFPLGEDRAVNVPGPLGTTTVQIKSGRVRVLDSPCPRRICVSRGWVEAPGARIACVPNGVFVEVVR